MTSKTRNGWLLAVALVTALGISALPGGSAYGAADAWQLDADRSRLEFSVQVMGGDFSGEFERFSADVVFDPADPGAGRIEAEIDMTATSTGMGDADRALPTAPWFDIDNHPGARFAASNFVATEQGFEGDAELVVKGKTLALRFPFSWNEADGGARLESEVRMDRRAFGVGTGEFDSDDTVGFDVTVAVDVFLVR